MAAYSERPGSLFLDFAIGLVPAHPIRTLQVNGGPLQGVRVPQKPWPDASHYHGLANLAELLLEDPIGNAAKEVPCQKWEHDFNTCSWQGVDIDQ